MKAFSSPHNYISAMMSGDVWTGENSRPNSNPLSSPRFSQMVFSKRVRVTTIIIFLLVFLTIFSHHQLPGFQYSAPLKFPSTVLSASSVDWSRFAYVQYVTTQAYLCNSVMLFEILHLLEAKADLLMYPVDYHLDNNSEESKLLLQARELYGVKLTPIDVQRRPGNDVTWAENFTKLLAFNQTQYDRILSLDSDSTVLKSMDELFLLPSAPIAIPRAFWLDPKDHVLSSQIVLVEPSEMEFKRVVKAIETAGPNDYDMEIFNNLYGDSALIIPHRKYDLITRAFREDHAKAYLGNDYEEWDAEKVLEEASFLHFSDWPVPKPWVPSRVLMEENAPKCVGDNCKVRDIWLGFYQDFARRRKDICGIETPGVF